MVVRQCGDDLPAIEMHSEDPHYITMYSGKGHSKPCIFKLLEAEAYRKISTSSLLDRKPWLTQHVAGTKELEMTTDGLAGESLTIMPVVDGP